MLVSTRPGTFCADWFKISQQYGVDGQGKTVTHDADNLEYWEEESAEAHHERDDREHEGRETA